jgi:hypothetical protein
LALFFSQDVFDGWVLKQTHQHETPFPYNRAVRSSSCSAFNRSCFVRKD